MINKVKNYVKKMVIDRTKWAFGEECRGYLYDNGKYCIIGHYLKQCGYKSNELDGVAEPEDLMLNFTPLSILESSRAKKVRTLLNVRDSDCDGLSCNDICNEIMTINDNERLPPEEREAKITQLFKQIGTKVEFSN